MTTLTNGYNTQMQRDTEKITFNLLLSRLTPELTKVDRPSAPTSDNYVETDSMVIRISLQRKIASLKVHVDARSGRAMKKSITKRDYNARARDELKIELKLTNGSFLTKHLRPLLPKHKCYGYIQL